MPSVKNTGKGGKGVEEIPPYRLMKIVQTNLNRKRSAMDLIHQTALKKRLDMH